MHKLLQKFLNSLVPVENLVINDLKETVNRLQVELKGKSEFIHKQYHILNATKKELQAYKEDKFCQGGCAVYQFDKIEELKSELVKLNATLKEKEESIQSLSDQNLDLSAQLSAMTTKFNDLKESNTKLEQEYRDSKSELQVMSLDLGLQKNLTEKFFSLASDQESKLKSIQEVARKCGSCPDQNCEDATRLDCREEIVDKILQIL